MSISSIFKLLFQNMKFPTLAQNTKIENGSSSVDVSAKFIYFRKIHFCLIIFINFSKIMLCKYIT